MSTKVVLITGCSSGIGNALCREFHRRGLRVVATARHPETLQELRSAGILTDRLDVNHADDVRRVVDTVLAREAKLDILVNNAGYGLMGPVIDLSEEEWAAQFRTHVLGPLSLIRRVAAAMRENGGGLIVNMGSISGVVPTPFSGAYCASKAALHALSDVARMELAPFGIRVVTVQAGAVRSRFGANARELASRLLETESWYRPLEAKILARATLSQLDATPAEVFARRLVDVLLRRNPPGRVRLGKRSRLLPLLNRLMPLSVLERYLEKRFGLLSLTEM